MVSRVREAAWAQSRSCQPVTMTGLEAPSASATGLPVRVATDLRPSASAAGLRTPTASGPTVSGRPGARPPTAVASAKASKLCSSPIHRPCRPARVDRGGDVEGLGRGPVEPERQHALDARAHSIEASACWPSRMRPGSSREAALTWKWAVAVWASRKRRCSGASS